MGTYMGAGGREYSTKEKADASKASSSNSPNSSSGKTSSGGGAKTIADYQAAYKTAYDNYDYSGMRAANDAANAIRTANGQATYSSAVGDAQHAGLAKTGNTYGTDYLVTTQSQPSTYTPAADQQPATYTDPDIQSKIAALAEAQRQSKIDALTKARDNALSGLDSSVSTINNNYYDKRNQAAAQSDVGAMNFAQYMASRGVQGNAGAMPEMYRNAGLQSQLGSLNNQQVSDLNNIETNRSNIQSNYQSDIASAAADAEATKLQNYITQMNADRTYSANQANIDRTYNTNQANTAQSNFDNTVYAYNNDYQAQINKLQSLLSAGQVNDTDGVSLEYKINALNAARNQKIKEQEDQARADAQQQLENEMKQKQNEMRQQQINYQTRKPYYKPTTSSSTTKKYTASQIDYALANGWIDDTTAQALMGF